MRPLTMRLLVGGAVSLLVACGARATQPAVAVDAAIAHEDEPEKHPELPSRVALAPDVVQAAHIRVAPAATEVLPVTVSLTGEVGADPDRAARVGARMPGRIVDVRIKDGQHVRVGDVLAVIESADLARARAALTAARARAEAARRNAERLARLGGKGLAAGQEADNAAADARSLEAEETAARQSLAAFGPGALDVEANAARIALRSPIDGTVLRRDAMIGQTVTPDHVIAELADLDRLYFLARLFEKDLARVAVGAAAEVRLNAFPGELYAGRVEAIGGQLDPSARTVVARIAIANRTGHARIGLFGVALVSTGESASAPAQVVVPLSAVTKVSDKDVLFVREPDGDFELHRVTLGRSAGGRVEILSGLGAGEAVVIDGVMTLKGIVLKGSLGGEDD